MDEPTKNQSNAFEAPLFGEVENLGDEPIEQGAAFESFDDFEASTAEIDRERSEARQAAQKALNRDEEWRKKAEAKTRRAIIASGVSCGLAVVIAVIAGYFWINAANLIDTLGDQVAPIVTVRRDVPRGAVLSTADLMVQNVPVKFAPADSVRARSVSEGDAAAAIAQVAGKQTTVALSANEPVSSGLVQGGSSTSDVTINVQPGRYAMTIQLDTSHGLVPLLHVGDRVNVLQAVEGSDMADILISDAKVIALDGYLNGGPDTYSTVTLDLDEAETRLLASSSQPWLAVLSMTDRQAVDATE